jgi:transglutaminase-like putative cysteine protease
MEELLKPSAYIDSRHPDVCRFALEASGTSENKKDQAVRLYYAVRDGFTYNPYCMTLTRDHYRASYVLERKEGFCIQKAILLAAAARAMGIPSRLGFATVRNHLATKKMLRLMKTDLFVFHGYTTMFIDGSWVKATPAFDIKLCERFGVLPLEFNGSTDSIFHPFDSSGKRHMEYVHDYGVFDDFPFEKMIDEFKKYYPHVIEHFSQEKEIPTVISNIPKASD